MTESKGAPVRKLHTGEKIVHKMKLGDDATTTAKQLTLENYQCGVLKPILSQMIVDSA